MSLNAAQVLLTDLQAQSNSKFTDLTDVQQNLMEMLFVSNMGFSDEHIPYRFGCSAGVEQIKTWKKCDNTLEELSRYTGARSRSLFLAGGVGAGKTGWLSAMAKNWFKSIASKSEQKPYLTLASLSRQARFITHLEFTDLAHAQYREEQVGYSLEDLADMGLLCLDDIGTAPETEYNLSRLEALLDYRKSCDLTTWMSSNISARDLRSRPGWERIVSRMSDNKWLTVYEIPLKCRRRNDEG